MIECALGFYEKVQAAFGGQKSRPEPPIHAISPKATPPAVAAPAALTRYFTGVVTSLDDGGGMIDHQVCFEQSRVVGDERVEVGATVHVEAAREHHQAGWRATRVQLVAHWRPDASSSSHVVVGFITNIGRTQGIVNDGSEDVRFPLTALDASYRPSVGDWVQARVLEQDDAIVITSVTPLRRRAFSGVVTLFNKGEGTVGDDVSFAAGVVANGYRPRLGDEVSGECVECRHAPPCVWRALCLQPSASVKPQVERFVCDAGNPQCIKI